ncbi:MULTISPECIES: DUF2182 domain-containing protein [Saliphagus]|uniref:DUF2182 domain-containing protein n=1 Tax=Saliphagus infecundisoli TaxID=1849069 RepID=A0ABD5QN21_9EURY|nr:MULTISPECIES: DUF2182 domain-containing protein [Saliphagus]
MIETSTFTDRIALDDLPIAATGVYALTAVLWLAVLDGWLPMAMAVVDAPMTAPGVPELMATENGLYGVGTYLLMWGAMMMAMMLPSAVPVVRRYRRAACGSPRRTAIAVAGFLGAYALVWTLVGVVPLATDALVSIHGVATTAGRPFVAGLFLLAGAFQLSARKRRFLSRCRAPDGTLCSSPVQGVKHGVAHAAGCVGCTWALFALMVGLGSMNAVVMLAITLVVSIERLSPNGEEIAGATGVVLLAAGVLTLAVGGPLVP